MPILGKYKNKVKNTVATGGYNQRHGNQPIIITSDSIAYNNNVKHDSLRDSTISTGTTGTTGTTSTQQSEPSSAHTSPEQEDLIGDKNSVIIIGDESSTEEGVADRGTVESQTIHQHTRKFSASSRSTKSTVGTQRHSYSETPMRQPRTPSSNVFDPDQVSPANTNRASVYSITSISEYDRAQLLRDEITRESQSLQRLEQLAKDLPKFSSNHHNTYKSYYQSSSVAAGDYSSATGGETRSLSSGHGNGNGNDWQSTSKVIERLQNGIDSLRRELREQKEITKEECAGKDAARKRGEILESTMEVLKHQNDMLNRLLDRKERKITELNANLKMKDDQIETLTQAQKTSKTMKQKYEEQIAQQKEEHARIETAYKAIHDSNRRLKEKYHEDVKVIGQKITSIQLERQKDHDKVVALGTKVDAQTKERDHLVSLQNQSSELRKRQMKEIEAVIDEVKRSIAESDKTMHSKVKNALLMINQLERQYIELGGTDGGDIGNGT